MRLIDGNKIEALQEKLQMREYIPKDEVLDIIKSMPTMPYKGGDTE